MQLSSPNMYDISFIHNVERYLANFVANFPGFAYTFRLSPDGHGCFPFASPGIEKLYGLKPEDVQDDMTPLHAMASPEDAHHIIASLEQSARTMQPVRVEFRICRPGFSVRWAEFHSVPERQRDGSTLWYGIMQDITERKQMQEALIARELEFRSLAENLPDNIARWDIAGRCLYSNPTHQRTLGKTLEEMSGKTLREIFGDDRYAFFDEVMAQVIATRQEAEVLHVPVSMPDGGTDYHDVRLAPEFDGEGRVISVLGIGRNMTDAYRMQETIAQREQEFRSLAENSPNAIIRYDREGRIRYLNSRLARDLAVSPADVIGKLPSEAWPDGRYDVIQQAAKQAQETEAEVSIELCAQSAGEPDFYQIQIVPERDVAGQVNGTIAFGVDISAIRNAERRLTDVVANLPGFAYIFRMSPDGHGSFPFASSGIEKLCGLQPKDVRVDMASLHALAHPEDRPRIEAAIAESARTMSPFNVEYRLCRPDQPQRWVECRSVPTVEHDGSIIWHGLMIEITERKQVEVEQQRLLNILEQFADFVGSANMDGTLRYHNPAARRMVGLSDDVDLSAMHISDMHPAWAVKRMMEEALPIVLTHGVWRGENVLLHRDGREIPVSQVIILHRDAKGRPEFMSTIMQDITERKQAEARLVLQNHALSHIGEAIYLLDEEGRILQVNNAASNMLGYTQDELLAMRIYEIDPGVDSKSWRQHWDDLMVRGTITLETTHRSKMGNLISIEVNANAITHEGRDYNFALVRDISERKQVQETLQRSQSLLENAQRIAHIGIWDVDMVNDVLTWSDETFHIWEIDKTKFKATFAAFLETVHPEDRDKVTAAYNQAIKDKSLYQVEHRLLFPDGRVKYIHERGEPFFDAQGRPIRFIGTSLDITELSRQQLLEAQRQRVFETMAQGGTLVQILLQVAIYIETSLPGLRCSIMLLKDNGCGLYCVAAPSFSKAAAIESIEITNFGGCCAAAARSVERVMVKDMHHHPCWETCQEFCTQNSVLACWAEPIIASSGQVLGVVTAYLRESRIPEPAELELLRQASRLCSIAIERKQLESQMLHQASYDSLTGLPNRRLFGDRLREEVAKAERSGSHLAILFIDLDYFKEVNDTLGHHYGDQLLINVSSRIRQCVRESDTVARLGGDEFVVLLLDVSDCAGLERVAQSIIDRMAAPVHLDDQVAYTSASIGIARYPADASSITALMSAADQAMYAAKSKGRNCFSFFTLAMQQQAQQRLLLGNELRDAISKEQLQIFLQPIMDISSGHVVKAEALVRWKHPQHGMVPPDKFIPIAEEMGLIHDIGDWVFHQAAQAMQRWLEICTIYNGVYQISVNMSARQFVHGDVGAAWIDYLSALGIPKRHIVIEITESLLLGDETDVRNKLQRFRDAGMNIALDDFGTGYSSMSYLKKFNIDFLKIDRSFVRDLETDPNDRAIAEAIVVMAHKLGLKTIAEGVETEQQKAMLEEVGCDFVQGYFCAKPMPVDEFMVFVNASGVNK